VTLVELRSRFHQRLCKEVIRLTKGTNGDDEIQYPNFADKGNRASIQIAKAIVERLGCKLGSETIAGQRKGGRFEEIVKDFLEESFAELSHLRPGAWRYSTQLPISLFDQYEHLAPIDRIVKASEELTSALGQDYIITPDILIGRVPVSDDEINRDAKLVSSSDSIAKHTPLRASNNGDSRVILHASISCKWTLRSDRAQNARTEAQNLIRNRKGKLPHVVCVTAEPLPTRVASLALGTGDLDCVYNFALPELQAALNELSNEDQLDMLNVLVEGRRLRDISDLPFDLAA